jgi:predicted AAA+ superfamily ATPase
MIENLAKIARFNFWENKPNTGFRRPVYLDRLDKYRDSNLIRVLVGQRRVGKSYIMRQVIEDLLQKGVLPKNTLYINMEYLEYSFIKNEHDLIAFFNLFIQSNNIEGDVHLFIDEVQNINSWEKAVNALSQDFTRRIHVYLTGSNAHLLSGELATFLSGRYVKFLVLPFSYEEFITIKGIQKTKSAFLDYLQTGGMPELFRLRDDESKRQYLSAIYDTVLLRDVVERHQVRDVGLLKDVFAFVVNNIGNLFSVANLVNFFKSQQRKTNYETVAQYLKYLEDAYLIHKCERYDIKGKELLTGNVKYYLNDLSFKHYLFPGVNHGWGYLMENLVYLELLNNGFEIHAGHLKYFEIDFVAKKADRLLYIQSVYLLNDEQTREREYRPLNAVADHFEKMVLSADDLSGAPTEGINHKLVWKDWL